MVNTHPHEKDPATAPASPWATMGLVASLGLTVALPIVAGVLAGRYLQMKFGAGGGIMAACVLGGVFAGLAGAVITLLRESGWKR